MLFIIIFIDQWENSVVAGNTWEKSAAGDHGSVGRLLSERRPWKFYPDWNPADCRRTGGRRDV